MNDERECIIYHNQVLNENEAQASQQQQQTAQEKILIKAIFKRLQKARKRKTRNYVFAKPNISIFSPRSLLSSHFPFSKTLEQVVIAML